MRLLIICSIVLLSSCETLNLAKNSYSVELAPRGLSFNHDSGGRILETRLCNGDYCLFVELRELRLLNIDLGDTNNAVFNAVSSMNDFDRSWLFKELERAQAINPLNR